MKHAPPPGWRFVRRGRALSRIYVLKDFAAGAALIRRIAALAEKLDHHPDLHLTGYRRLRVVLTSHDAGGVTGRDRKLAAGIDALPKRLRARRPV